jgi:hypothetical protein
VKLKLKFRTKFPALVQVVSPLTLVKEGLSYTFGIDINALVASIGAAFVAPRAQRIITVAGAITAQSTDDIIVVKKSVGAATTVNVDWSTRTRPLTVVDGKGDAATNNISIVPASGQTIYAVTNGTALIDGNGGSVTLTPLVDGTGAF